MFYYFLFDSGPDPSFNPNLFSEDEEETFLEPQGAARTPAEASAPPIAPMTPRNTRLNLPRPKSQLSSQFLIPEASPLSRTDSYDEDFPYVDRQGISEYSESLRSASSSTFRPSRHNPPRCCDVPALQSPKNSVAPTQTLIATSNPTNDYSGSIQRVKSALADHQTIRKELENNKINQNDEKLSPSTNIIPTSLPNCQNGSTSSLVYLNFPGMLLQNCPSSFVHQKSSLKASGCHLGNSSPSSVPSQASSGIPKTGNVTTSGLISPTCSSHPGHSPSQACGQSQCPYKRKEPKMTGCCGKTSANHTNQVNVSSGKADDIRFIDDESSKLDEDSIGQMRSVHRTSTVVSIGPLCPALDPIVRSCSVGYLDLVDAQMVPCDVALKMLRKEAPNKRLVLVSRKTKKRRKHKGHGDNGQQSTKPRLRTCGKSKSLDSSDLFPSTEQISLPPQLPEHLEEVGLVNENMVSPNEDGEKTSGAEKKFEMALGVHETIAKDYGKNCSPVG